MRESTERSLEYFEITADHSCERNWFLDVPKLEISDEEVDVWRLSSGMRFDSNSQLMVPVQRKGNVTDITFSHYFITYMQPRVGNLLEAFAHWDIQRVPARLESGEDIEVLNVLTILDCMDQEHSEATYKGQNPNMVLKLRIRSHAAVGHHIFRLSNWRGPLIISELILEQLQRIGTTGFVPTKIS